MKYFKPQIHDIYRTLDLALACCQEGAHPSGNCSPGGMPLQSVQGCSNGSVPSYLYCCLGSNLFSGECGFGGEMGLDCNKGSSFK